MAGGITRNNNKNINTLGCVVACSLEFLKITYRTSENLVNVPYTFQVVAIWTNNEQIEIFDFWVNTKVGSRLLTKLHEDFVFGQIREGDSF